MKVIAIDLDGTASTHPEKVNKLYHDQNNFIVIYTSRPEKNRQKTEAFLKELGIKYHSLVMEKLRADVYIDNKNSGGLQWPENQLTLNFVIQAKGCVENIEKYLKEIFKKKGL